MYQSFMVRLWREDGQAMDQVLISAESIQSGELRHFETLTMLLDYLRDSAETSNDAGRDLSKSDIGNSSSIKLIAPEEDANGMN
jgi:hypothetical protein